MIWDSQPWKKDLWKSHQKLSKWQAKRRWTEADNVAVEKEIFIELYAIRKLLDAHKLSFECRDRGVPVRKFKAKEKKADFMNWHKLDELYEFDRFKKAQISLRDLCNSIVHSYVFMTCMNESDSLEGFLFNTDRDKHEQLLYLSIDHLKKVRGRVQRRYCADDNDSRPYHQGISDHS